jgi:hypothetical protein
MLAALIQINTKELFRGIFSVAWSFIWTFKWYLVALLGMVLFAAFLERLVEIKKFRKILKAERGFWPKRASPFSLINRIFCLSTQSRLNWGDF